MIEYLVIACMSIAVSFVASQAKGLFRYILIGLTAIPGSLLASMRFGIGPDYGLYQQMFESIAMTGGFFSVKSIEPGYVFLNKMVSAFGGSFHQLLFIVAWIVEVLFLLGIEKYRQNIVLGCALFFAMGFYFDSFNGLRQYIAASITFYSISYLIEGQKKYAIAGCLLATLFHQSAIMVLPFCFLLDRIDLTTSRLLACVVAFLLLGNFLYNIIFFLLKFSRYRYFIDSVEFVVEPTISTVVLTGLMSIVAICVGVYKKSNPRTSTSEADEHRVIVNMNLLALLSAILSFFVPLALRVQYYFTPFEMVFLPYLLSSVKDARVRFLLGVFLVGFVALMTTAGMMINGWYGAYPYKAIG